MDYQINTWKIPIIYVTLHPEILDILVMPTLSMFFGLIIEVPYVFRSKSGEAAR